MSLKKSIGSSIVGKSIFIASGYLLNIIISHYYAATGVGIINYLLNNFGVAAMFLTVGVDSTLCYFLANGQMRIEKVVTTALSISFVIQLLTGLGLWAYAHFYAVDSKYVFTLFLFINGIVLTNAFTTLFNATNKFIVYNIIAAMLPLLLSITIGLCIWKKYALPVPLFLLIYGFLSYVMGTVLAVVFIKKNRVRKYISPNTADIKLILQQSVVFFSVNCSFFLLTRVDYWFVKYYCSAYELGNYIQTSKFIQLVLLLPSMVSFALFPSVAKNPTATMKPTIVLLAKIYFYAAIVFCGVFVAIGSFVFPFVFGSSFNSMANIFIAFVPGILLLAYAYPFAVFFPGVNKSFVNLHATSIALVLILVLLFAIMPGKKLYAAALINSVGYVVYTLYFLYYFKKEYPIKSYQLFLFSKADGQVIKKALLSFPQSFYFAK
jgi:O-antigen/teichoic acid export membrane protein